MTSFTRADTETLLAVLRAELKQPVATLDELAAAADTWDSITLVNILFEVEQQFHIVFSAKQMEQFKGLPSLIAIIEDARRSASA